jgi:hypothetical protein
MIEFGCAFVLGAGAGAALVWLCKTGLQTWLSDANALAAKLRAEAKAVAALARKV